MSEQNAEQKSKRSACQNKTPSKTRVPKKRQTQYKQNTPCHTNKTHLTNKIFKIPNKIYNKVIKWAKLAHELLGCSGISRSDFRYDDRNGKTYMLEINTQPGMTKTSLSPEQAKYCGISLTELVDKLISKAKFEKVCLLYTSPSPRD